MNPKRCQFFPENDEKSMPAPGCRVGSILGRFGVDFGTILGRFGVHFEVVFERILETICSSVSS